MHPESAILMHNYLYIIFVTIFFYDFVTVLPREIEHVWKCLTSRGSWWYLLIRYLNFVGFIMVLVFNFVDVSPKGCSYYAILRQALLVLNVLIIGIVFTMRTYALYNCSKYALAIILLPSITLFSFACWSLRRQEHPVPYMSISHGCHVATSRSQGVHIAVAWLCLVGFDSYLFILTTARAIRYASTTPRDLPDGAISVWQYALQSLSGADLFWTIYRDVALYFGVMALFNMANLITLYMAHDLLRGSLSTPSSAISALLCSRLLLNIREATSAPRGISTDLTSV